MKVERAALREQLLDAGEELAAQLLDYHDRERKPVWWAFFDRVEMTPTELVEDSESIGRLEHVGEPRAGEALARRTRSPSRRRSTSSAQGQRRARPGDARSRRARSSSSTARRAGSSLKRGPSLRGRAAARGAHPGRARTGRDDQEDALVRLGRSLLAGDRRYPALESMLRREPFDRPIQTVRPRRDEGARALARRPPPRHPGAARLGEDVDVRAADRAPARARQDGRRRLDEPQGDPQPARRGRRGGGRARDRLRRAQEGERRQPGVVLRQRADRERRARRRDASAATSPPARRGSSPARTSTLDYLFIDEAGQVSLADALAMGTAARNLVLVGDPQQLDQVIQGTHPVRQRRLGAPAPARRRGDDPARPRPLPRAHVPAAPGRLRLHLGGVLRGAARAGRRWRAERTTPLGTGLRYVAGRARRAQAGVARGGRRPCAASGRASYAPPA